MKKYLLSVIAVTAAAWPAQAQISKGGRPLSYRGDIAFNTIPVAAYADPDWKQYMEEEKAYTGLSQPAVAALCAETDFGFPQSGQLIRQSNGQRIWRGKIMIPGAPAIGLLYDRFKLPAGVRLFLSNDNGRQVLGAFDASNNDRSGVFVTDAVQGSTVTIELNIEPNVNLSDILLHINKAAVFHRAIEHLQVYAGEQPLDQIDAQLNGSSSTCMVNAICPQGSRYGNNRKATVQLLIFKGNKAELCSGTLVNNTGNSEGNCTPYILTATHCEKTGSTNNTTFNQTLVRFNFEYKNCAGAGAQPTSNSMTGVNIIARAAYDSTVPASSIKGDFMLLQLRQAIPMSYGAVLSGWNNSTGISTTVAEPKKFIGFHHPDGDNKKLSYSHQIQSTGFGSVQTHWTTLLESSYASTGSSGSGLFDGDGYLIGQLSTGGNYFVPASCRKNAAGEITDIGDRISYSKFSYVWDYAVDGAAANRKLKPWLDPGNTGVATVSAVKSDCTDAGSGIDTGQTNLTDQILVYPTAVTQDWLQVQYNLVTNQDIVIRIYDCSGRAIITTTIANVKDGVYPLNLSALSNGMYMVLLQSGAYSSTRKIMVLK